MEVDVATVQQCTFNAGSAAGAFFACTFCAATLNGG